MTSPRVSGARHQVVAHDEGPRLRQARAADGRQDRPHRGRAGDRDASPRVHDQPARGMRRRGGGAARRGGRRRVGRAHARPARGRGAAARRDGARHRPRHPPRLGRRRVGSAGDCWRDRRRDPRRRGRSTAPSISSSSATRLPTAGTTRSGSGSRTRSGARWRPGSRASPWTDGTVRCEQEVAGGRDVYQLPLPAVVTVKEGPQPAALPVGARPAARAAEAGRRLDLARAPRRRASRSCGSSFPRARARRPRSSATAPTQHPPSSTCCQDRSARWSLRWMLSSCLELSDGRAVRRLAPGADIRPRLYRQRARGRRGVSGSEPRGRGAVRGAAPSTSAVHEAFGSYAPAAIAQSVVELCRAHLGASAVDRLGHGRRQRGAWHTWPQSSISRSPRTASRGRARRPGSASPACAGEESCSRRRDLHAPAKLLTVQPHAGLAAEVGGAAAVVERSRPLSPTADRSLGCASGSRRSIRRRLARGRQGGRLVRSRRRLPGGLCDHRGARRAARRRGRVLPRGDDGRLASPHRPGGPDGDEDRA